MKTILSIAGSDSSGGAGIQADIKTACYFKVYSCTAITSITAQNTQTVKEIYNLPPKIIAGQIRAVLEDIKIDTIKIGMLSTTEIIKTVASELKDFKGKIVLDPVMVSTSKARLLDSDAIDSLKNLLFPISYIITPNLDEAEVLSGEKIETAEQMIVAGERLKAKYQLKNILIKGGHLKDTNVIYDILLDENGVSYHFSKPKIATKNTHGTGCSMASSIACNLALGNNIIDSIKISKDFVYNAIENAPENLGKGFGPINHF